MEDERMKKQTVFNAIGAQKRRIKLFLMILALSLALFCLYAVQEIRYWQSLEEVVMDRYYESNITLKVHRHINPEHLKPIADKVF